ncbi:MAG: GNAT family N-acetyltransferase, partial [Candidatus Methanomethylophilaceae archaeon]|nr:GNAT family N-acetyltransferase [Candidatus Methanomethylophilaceae archaeon]
MIETERLVLRPFDPGDAEDVYEYLREPLVNCFASMRLDSLDAARALMEERSKDRDYCFAIVLKDCGMVIGEIEAYPESHGPDEGSGA